MNKCSEAVVLLVYENRRKIEYCTRAMMCNNKNIHIKYNEKQVNNMKIKCEVMPTTQAYASQLICIQSTLILMYDVFNSMRFTFL